MNEPQTLKHPKPLAKRGEKIGMDLPSVDGLLGATPRVSLHWLPV